MSIAAAQYNKFKEQVVCEGRVFTFYDNGYLQFSINGRIVIPFWSTKSRLEKTQANHPKYRAFGFKELTFEQFFRWLPSLQNDGIYIGVNWSGKGLTGYDVEPNDLISGLQYWMEKLGKSE